MQSVSVLATCADTSQHYRKCQKYCGSDAKHWYPCKLFCKTVLWRYAGMFATANLTKTV